MLIIPVMWGKFLFPTSLEMPYMLLFVPFSQRGLIATGKYIVRAMNLRTMVNHQVRGGSHRL